MLLDPSSSVSCHMWMWALLLNLKEKGEKIAVCALTVIYPVIPVDFRPQCEEVATSGDAGDDCTNA